MTFISLLSAGLGSVALEVVHWYNLREDLQNEKYQRLVRSPSYWIPTMLMIALGAVAVPGYLGTSLRTDQLFAAGAAFPTTIKKLVGAGLSRRETHLGQAPLESRISFRDYFLIARKANAQ